MTLNIGSPSQGNTEPSITGRRLSTLLDRTASALEVCAGTLSSVLFMAMTVLVLLGIIFRYIIEDPLQWSEELARFVFLWGGFLAISVALRRNEHIRIDLILRKIPRIAQEMTNIAIDVVSGVFLAILAVKGYHMATNSFMKAMSMDFSMAWVYMAVPIGASLALIQLILALLQRIIKRTKWHS